LTAAGARHPDRRGQHLEHAAKLPIDTAVARRAARATSLPNAGSGPGTSGAAGSFIVDHGRSAAKSSLTSSPLRSTKWFPAGGQSAPIVRPNGRPDCADGNTATRRERLKMSLFLDALMETILTFAAVVECIAAGILLHRLLR
jgi:hypothetical protein